MMNNGTEHSITIQNEDRDELTRVMATFGTTLGRHLGSLDNKFMENGYADYRKTAAVIRNFTRRISEL